MPRRAFNFNTPPRLAWLVHSSSSLMNCLSFTPSPSLMGTPSFWTKLAVHPSVLHRIIFAPCMMHSPSLKTLFVHSSVLHLVWPLRHVLCTLLPSEHRDRVWLDTLYCCISWALHYALCALLHSEKIEYNLHCCIAWAWALQLAWSWCKLLFSEHSIVCASITGVFLELCPMLDANSSILGLGMIVHPSAEFSYRILYLYFFLITLFLLGWSSFTRKTLVSHLTFALLVW